MPYFALCYLGPAFYVSRSTLSPALQIGRMSIPETDDEVWNVWYNVEFIPGFRIVSGVQYVHPYQVVEGSGAVVPTPQP